MKFLVLSICYFIALFSNGQTLSSDPFNNPVILNHYTVKDLQLLQKTDTVKFKTIAYYYSESFIFEEVECKNCERIHLASFDVSQYEYLRQKNKRYSRTFEKHGFKLTLLSIDELTYKLPIHFSKEFK